MRHLLLIALVLFSLSACDRKSAREYLIEAEKLEEQQKYKEAIPLLDKAIEKDEKLLGAYINRGADKSVLGDFKGAITDYQKVIALDPKNTLAYFNIGNNYKRLGGYEFAISYYDKAFKIKGGDYISLDLVPNGIIDESEFDVPAIRIHFERGLALYQVGSYQKAINDLLACAKKSYRAADCYYWLGLCYMAMGQNKLACENFSNAAQMGDKDAQAELSKHCKE